MTCFDQYLKSILVLFRYISSVLKGFQILRKASLIANLRYHNLFKNRTSADAGKPHCVCGKRLITLYKTAQDT